jgi:HAD superfamily hydrolase (TIGR01509 family)
MKLPRPPAAVIFDMDGLLFDTERFYAESIMTAAAEVGCPMSHDVFLQLVGRSREVNHAFLVSHYGPDYPLAALIATWGRHFQALTLAGLPLKPGAIELLDLLDELGLPRAIATSNTHATIQRNLSPLNLADRFHAVIGHGDYASGKPAPDPFLKAAERLGVSPALCLALEDSHNGVRSAAAAGMMAVMVPDLIPATDEIQGLCIHVVADLHAVRRLIENGVSAPATPAASRSG